MLLFFKGKKQQIIWQVPAEKESRVKEVYRDVVYICVSV